MDTTLKVVPGTNLYLGISGNYGHHPQKVVPGTYSIFEKEIPENRTTTWHTVSTLDLDPPLCRAPMYAIICCATVLAEIDVASCTTWGPPEKG